MSTTSPTPSGMEPPIHAALLGALENVLILSGWRGVLGLVDGLRKLHPQGAPLLPVDFEIPTEFASGIAIPPLKTAGDAAIETLQALGYTYRAGNVWKAPTVESVAPLTHIDEVETAEQAWEFWRPIVVNNDGSVNVDQLKLELADYSMLMRFTAIVYEHATGGQCTKATTLPSVVKALIDDHITEICDGDDEERDMANQDAAYRRQEEIGLTAGWISTHNRLPSFQDGEDGERVLVLTADHDFEGAQVHDIPASDFYTYNAEDDDPGTEVTKLATHWMPRGRAISGVTPRDRDDAIRMWHKHCDKFSDSLGKAPPTPVIDAMLEFATAPAAVANEPVRDAYAATSTKAGGAA